MNSAILEEKLQYTFKDKKLIEKALTHSSYCREGSGSQKVNNERLEFLGDAFFDAVISSVLYEKMKDVDEGKLTKTRAQIVCEKSLASVSRKMSIGDFLNMGKGEEHLGGRQRESILADALEAIIGAIFLDGGYEAAAAVIKREFAQTVDDALAGKLFADYKTQIQEALQKRGKHTVIRYIVDRSEGPDHDKTFFVHLEYNGKILGSGSGKSKKEAEQHAAKAALTREETLQNVF